ncbi:MAG: endonuclease/exonuclease/phosphatase family protein [Bacteroidia bacterium]|nr:endonuclease/exonuclease/phosphatase family protein [Bacteroidia bacterium]
MIQIRHLISFFIIIVINSGCSKESGIDVDAGGSAETIEVAFAQQSANLTEGSVDIVIDVIFSKEIQANSTVIIGVNEVSGAYGQHYTTSPVPSGNTITLLADAGSSKAEILINTAIDNDLKTEQIDFEILNVIGAELSIGAQKTMSINIEDNTPVAEQYRDCLLPMDNQELDIATWNVRTFPLNGNTIGKLADVIVNMNVDIIAFQEIRNINSFHALGQQLGGWESRVQNISGDIELGFLYKTSEIVNFGTMKSLFENDHFGFPREAVEVDISHINGLHVKLINIHLKCCSDGEQRRATASSQLKVYIDTKFPSANVIVLGDFNDDIRGGSPFANFIGDTDDYFFADMDIAMGDSEYWSYPSFPSHIDHILCTNELADRFDRSATLVIDDCIGNYQSDVSDHLPVLATFK